MDSIIKLTNVEELYSCSQHQADNMDNYIVVIRKSYSRNLMAYFIRSKRGTLLVVNSNLPTHIQAKAISIIKENINKCGIAEAGVLKGDYDYYCGGSCCNVV